MEPTEAANRMRDAAVLWSIGDITAAELVTIACDLLVAGHDGPALRMLAAVSPRHADEDVPPILNAALGDVGLPYHAKDSQPGREAALRMMASRVLAGTLPPRQLAKWAHTTFGHDTLALAEPFAVLDDLYDDVINNATADELDADVMAEARRILHQPHASHPPDSSRTEAST